MSRITWFGLGIAAGFFAARKVNQAARAATPAGIGANLGTGLRELANAVGAFGAEVRAGMTEREAELSEHVLAVNAGSAARGRAPRANDEILSFAAQRRAISR